MSDEREGLAVKGLLWGLLLAAPFWALLGLLGWWWWHG